VPLDRFWSPFLSSGKPVLVYCGRPVAYFLARGVAEKYGPKPSQLEDRRTAAWVPLTLDPDAVLHGRDIIPVTDKFVGIGNAHAALRLNGLFAARHVATEVRYANDFSFNDLRGSPSILIGAFSNLWTLQMTKNLRFVFEAPGVGVPPCIRDRSNNRLWQLSNMAPDGTSSEDFAIVSRLLDSPTGQPLVCVAGIGTYGTRSAGEFLTDPSHFQEALAGAGAAWPKKNLQVVLRTDVYRGTPGRPQVLAVHIW
jgi:hypothetical protein